jgi:hypothetical protein
MKRFPVALAAATFIAGVGLSAAITSQAAPPAPAVLRAQRFELTDKEGRVRLNLSLRENGSAGVNLLDEKGRERLTLYTAPGNGSPGVLLKSSDGKPKIVLSTSQEDEGAMVVLFNKSGKPFPIQLGEDGPNSD